jgi:hypothetical protein
MLSVQRRNDIAARYSRCKIDLYGCCEGLALTKVA